MSKNFYSATKLKFFINNRDLITEFKEKLLDLKPSEKTRIDNLRIKKGLDHEAEYFKKLSKKEFDITFNLIFLDPPFKEQKINMLLYLISESNIIKKDGLLILHRNKKEKDVIDIKHEVLLEKIYGASRIFFIRL